MAWRCRNTHPPNRSPPSLADPWMFPALSEILLVSDPVDVEKLLRADGKWPNNRSEGFGVLEKIREKAGIPLGVLMALGMQLGCLDGKDLPPNCREFIQEVSKLFESILDMMLALPLYFLWEAKPYRAVAKAQNNVYQLAMNFISERLQQIEKEDKEVANLEGSGDSEGAPAKVDLLSYLIRSGGLSLEETCSNAVDFITAGVDTTSLALSWCLYSLAVNPQVQERLRREVREVTGSSDVVTPAHISDMHYMKLCIKETLRLYSIAGVNMRITQEDVVLSGYHVPTGVGELLRWRYRLL